MDPRLEEIRSEGIERFGHITSALGFGKTVGQVFGTLFFSKMPLSVTDLARELAISERELHAALSTLERWGMIEQRMSADQRSFQAQVDSWEIVGGLLRGLNESEKDAVERALKEGKLVPVTEGGFGFAKETIQSLEEAKSTMSGEDALLANFYLDRLAALSASQELFRYGTRLIRFSGLERFLDML